MIPWSPPPPGHNGGPPLEEPAASVRGRCRDCRHWHAPAKAEERAYERFRLGLSRRRVHRPTGACDRVVLSLGRAPAFSATSGDFGCVNFEPKPAPPLPSGGGFVTIWEGGRNVWQGAEEAMPARFRQTELDLFDPGKP